MCLYLGPYAWCHIRKYHTWQLLKIPQRQDGGWVEREKLEKDTLSKGPRADFFFSSEFLRYELDNCQGLSDSAKLSGKNHRNREGKEADLTARQ